MKKPKQFYCWLTGIKTKSSSYTTVTPEPIKVFNIKIGKKK